MRRNGRIPYGREVATAGQCLLAPEAPQTNPWLLWQLADSALPTGGFAHSAGLEAARQHGEISTREEFVGYLAASLTQAGHALLPFVTVVHTEPLRFPEADELCEAFTLNHVANRASRAQGRALLTGADRIFGAGVPGVVRLHELAEGETPLHYAPVFGAVTQALGVDGSSAQRLFLFTHLRGLMAASVRLNIVGPMEAQAIQHQLGARAESVLRRCAGLGLDDLAQTAPLHDLWQGAQDRLFSRLYQS